MNQKATLLFIELTYLEAWPNGAPYTSKGSWEPNPRLKAAGGMPLQPHDEGQVYSLANGGDIARVSFPRSGGRIGWVPTNMINIGPPGGPRVGEVSFFAEQPPSFSITYQLELSRELGQWERFIIAVLEGLSN